MGVDKTDHHIHNNLAFWLSRLTALMKDNFNRSLASSGVTWPQWMTLNVLHHELASTPAQVASHIGIDRSAVTRLLDRLADKGLLERRHDDGDRRSVKVFLTAKGEELMQSLNAQAAEHQAGYLAHLPATEVRAFKGNVQKLLRANGVETKTLWLSLD